MATKLLDNATGLIGGNYVSAAALNPDPMQRTFFCWGNFAEALVQIEFSPDGATWFKDRTGEADFTFNDVRTIRFAAGVHFRAVISNAGAGTVLNLWVF